MAANKTPANVRQWIEYDGSHCVVAVDGRGRIVVFASISGSEIMLNYVLPETLHQGVGKRLLKALKHHAIASDETHIHVVSSIPAKAFYARNGYVSPGPPKYVGRIVGDFPLVKVLNISSSTRLVR